MAFKYEFERPGLTVDCVIFGLDLDSESLKVMLIERDVEPLFEDAGLSPMAQRFYAECKRVSNAKAKAVYGWRPKFATYREGLADCLQTLRQMGLRGGA
jgi:nucleoside-diphosphate-sugar epimerase